MATCRICQQECTDQQQFCSNCGYPFPTTPRLDETSQPSPDVLSQTETWEREIWRQYEQLQQQQQELSRSYQYLQQKFEQQQQQITQLQQENARLQSQLEASSHSQPPQQQLVEQLREVLQENTNDQLEGQIAEQYQSLQQQISQLQQQIANLQQENTQLHQKLESQLFIQPQNPLDEVPLQSAVGYDYRRLRNLLAAGKWKQADKKTAHAMLAVAGREDKGFLRKKDIDNFPCEDLQTIDRLWVKSSNGKFGFSVQKQIYKSLGSTDKFKGETWIKFGDTVGWRREGEWKSYEKLQWYKATTLPKGYLPVLIKFLYPDRHVPVLNIVTHEKLWGLGVIFFSRVESCQL